jgi:hypothetical protein
MTLLSNIDLNSLFQSLLKLLHDKPENSNALPTFDNSGSFGANVLAKAKADLGVYEDLGKNDGKRIREYFKNFNMGGGQDWCAAAVSTWMKEAGGGPIAGGVGARNVGAQFAQIGKWVPRDKITPEAMTPGNIVVWSRGGPDSWKGHIGVLESFDGRNTFTSVEGNSGPRTDRVVVNTHSINDSNLLGVGILSDHVPQTRNMNVNRVAQLADMYYKLAISLR